MSDYGNPDNPWSGGHEQPHEQPHEHSHEGHAPTFEGHEQATPEHERQAHEPDPTASESGENDPPTAPIVLPTRRTRKRQGPRKMVDQPTQRFEGQMYVRQYEQSTQVINRLKREKASVPSAERRRLTLNTLVRVAMTVLLEHRSALKGTTEEELLEQFRRSLSNRSEQRPEES